jgi:hypothetical protein
MRIRTALFSTHIYKRSFLIGWSLAGFFIATGVLLLFLIGADPPNSDWASNWFLRPAIILPLAGLTGGFCAGVLSALLRVKVIGLYLAIAIGILIFLLALWMGIVLGFDGTYWN